MEYASFKTREFAASCVAASYPVGTIIGAQVALAVLDGFGWRGIFWAGAALSAVLFPIALVWLPESLDFLIGRQPKGALATTNRVLTRMDVPVLEALPPLPEGSARKTTVIDDILRRDHLVQLGILCIAHPLNMFAWYYIINWGPPLVSQSTGIDTAGAAYSGWVSYGGIVGGMATGFLCGKIGVRRMMWACMIALAVMITLFGQFSGNPAALMIIAPLTGAALFGSATANWLTIAYAFPPQLRATGLGLATLAGRVGAIFGPIAGGYLLNAGHGVAAVCGVMALPALLAAMAYSRARQLEGK
jgi:predicted MFS family arabinose efflux permease